LENGFRLFAVCVAVLQLAVASHVVRRPAGPFRLAVASLLVLNGLAAARLGILGFAPLKAETLFLLLDGATGPMLLTTGLLALRFPDHDLRDRKGWLILGTGLAGVGALVVLGLVPRADAGVATGPFEWLHTFPALVGLGIAGVGLARAVRTSRMDRIREAGLLSVGFLPTMAENVVAFADQAIGSDPLAVERLARSLGSVVLFAGSLATVALLLWPPRRHWTWRRLLLLTMVASGAAYLAYFQLGPSANPARAFAVFLGTTLSFYVLRPIGVGLAYSRAKTLLTLFDVACLAVLLVIGKGISALMLGVPFDELQAGDSLGFSIALLALAATTTFVHRRFGVKAQTQDRPSADELLGRFLVDQYRRLGPEAAATKQEIEVATGITENNVAAALRRLERRIDPKADPGTFVAERRIGVRGRKCYRLTAKGLAQLGPAPRSTIRA
jgi:hypothetical protein